VRARDLPDARLPRLLPDRLPARRLGHAALHRVQPPAGLSPGYGDLPILADRMGIPYLSLVGRSSPTPCAASGWRPLSAVATTGSRVAVLYTSVFEAIRDVKEEIREDMDLAINARSVAEALRSAGHDAWTLAFGKDPAELIARLRSSGAEAVFNLSECPDLSPEKELHACALLELLRLPYTGNGPLALGICNSKALSKQLMIANGVPRRASGSTPVIPPGSRGFRTRWS